LQLAQLLHVGATSAENVTDTQFVPLRRTPSGCRNSSAAAIAMISIVPACAFCRSLTNAESSLRNPHSRATVTSLSRFPASPSSATITCPLSAWFGCVWFIASLLKSCFGQILHGYQEKLN